MYGLWVWFQSWSVSVDHLWCHLTAAISQDYEPSFPGSTWYESLFPGIKCLVTYFPKHFSKIGKSPSAEKIHAGVCKILWVWGCKIQNADFSKHVDWLSSPMKDFTSSVILKWSGECCTAEQSRSQECVVILAGNAKNTDVTESYYQMLKWYQIIQ